MQGITRQVHPVECLSMWHGGSSIVNGGSGTDPPLRAVLDPVAAPTIVSEIHTTVPEPHTPWEPF